jgi:hypothetical protein
MAPKFVTDTYVNLTKFPIDKYSSIGENSPSLVTLASVYIFHEGGEFDMLFIVRGRPNEIFA